MPEEEEEEECPICNVAKKTCVVLSKKTGEPKKVCIEWIDEMANGELGGKEFREKMIDTYGEDSFEKFVNTVNSLLDDIEKGKLEL